VTTILPIARITIIPPPPVVNGGSLRSVRAVTALRPDPENEQPPLKSVTGPTVIGPAILTFPVTRITRPLGTVSDPVGVIVRLENWSMPLGGFTFQSTADEMVRAPSEPSP
jgi:hypothetical protein